MCSRILNIRYFGLFFILISIFGSIQNIDGEENDKTPESGNTEDLWEKDLSDAFSIDASTQGIQKVNLKCGADSMYVQLETEENFTGVMYTRGSFHRQTEPCFVKADNGKSRLLEMKFNLDQCQTIKEGDVFSNIVVVQHDPELVTPGDAAFSLECDFRKARSINVEANYQAQDREISYGSRITLTSPDPSASENREHRDTVHSKTNQVTYTPPNRRIISIIGEELDEEDELKNSQKNIEQRILGTVEDVSIEENIQDEIFLEQKIISEKNPQINDEL